jgi:GNAT superfamily N-acetyltransferase
MADAAAIAIQWAAQEGWNPGLDDGERFARADPGAFLYTERDGEVVATVSCARYGDAYAFIGMYIVRPDLRGQRVGRALFDRALEQAGDRIVGLDGVLEQQQTYERAGFRLAHRNTRYEGSGAGGRPAEVVGLSDVPAAALRGYDAAIFGTDRTAFLDAWIAGRPAGMALAVMDGTRVRGYAIGRRSRRGVKIGPLFADDAGAADQLFRGIAAAAGDRTPLFLDVPEPNADAMELAARYEMQPGFATVRMYRGGAPADDVDRVYGVTSFEFG